MIPSLHRLTTQKQTYTSIGYLLLSFPLGIFYFVFLAVGLTVGIGTLVVWVGVPVLLFVMWFWWKLAAMERAMAINWLKVDIPPMEGAIDNTKPLWDRVRTHLSNSVTWKSLLYLFLKLLIGSITFCITLSALVMVIALLSVTLSLGAVFSPFVFLFLSITGAFRRSRSTIISQSMKLTPPTRPLTVGRVLQISLTAGGIAFAPLYIINGMAWGWGQIARSMLGLSDKDLRLAEARAQAEQQRIRAEQADQKRRDLIINVSHELRTPVASIRGHLESLLNGFSEDGSGKMPSPEALQKYLTIVHRESVRLGSLVDDLLSLAKTEANELSLNISAVEAGTVVEEVYQTLMPLARRDRQITLVRAVTPGLPPVLADRQRLIQVILNLVRNAITYTPNGGIVSIALEPAGANALALSVADTGIGIPPEDLGRVFERFYRTDASRARTSGGFGLGLSIVKDFVTAMHGSITVESKVGEGTRFCVLLRVATATQQSPQNPAQHVMQQA
jgi:two-component system, OmpR family, phosphate regulon sensor histidine kinase PhoR